MNQSEFGPCDSFLILPCLFNLAKRFVILSFSVCRRAGWKEGSTAVCRSPCVIMICDPAMPSAETLRNVYFRAPYVPNIRSSARLFGRYVLQYIFWVYDPRLGVCFSIGRSLHRITVSPVVHGSAGSMSSRFKSAFPARILA